MDKKTYHSDSALSRQYSHIGFDVFDAERIDFYLQDRLRLVGVIKDKKEKTREMSNLIVFSLRFKEHKTIVHYPEGIEEQKVLQVDSVYTRPQFRTFGIASYVYSLLVEKGFIVVSDTSQLFSSIRLNRSVSA